jgi:hypothetical protein
MPNPDTGLPFTKEDHFAYWDEFFKYQFDLLDNPDKRQPVPYSLWPEDCLWHDVVSLLAGVKCPPSSTDWPIVGASSYSPTDYTPPVVHEITEADRIAAVYEQQLKQQYAPPQGRLNSFAETLFTDIVKDTKRMFMLQAEYDPADPFICKITHPDSKQKKDVSLCVWIGQLLELRKAPLNESDSAIGLFHWFVTVPKKKVIYQPAFRKPHADPVLEHERCQGGVLSDTLHFEVPESTAEADLESWRYKTEWEFTADQLVLTFDFDEVINEGGRFPTLTIPDENRIQAVKRLMAKRSPEDDGGGAAPPKKREASKKAKAGTDKTAGVKRKAGVFDLAAWGKRSKSGREVRLNQRFVH